MKFDFPPLIESLPTDAARASARLRFMLQMLALKLTARRSMRALAEHVSMDHSTLSYYIKRGAFSKTCAERIVECVGESNVSVNQLTHPLGKKAGKASG